MRRKKDTVTVSWGVWFGLVWYTLKKVEDRFQNVKCLPWSERAIDT